MLSASLSLSLSLFFPSHSFLFLPTDPLFGLCLSLFLSPFTLLLLSFFSFPQTEESTRLSVDIVQLNGELFALLRQFIFFFSSILPPLFFFADVSFIIFHNFFLRQKNLFAKIISFKSHFLHNNRLAITSQLKTDKLLTNSPFGKNK